MDKITSFLDVGVCKQFQTLRRKLNHTANGLDSWSLWKRTKRNRTTEPVF